MLQPIIFTPRLNHALSVAATAHRSQSRKVSKTPYIVHPIGVMLVASPYTQNEDTLITALLHDILEDVSPSIYSENDMSRDFGPQVLTMVKDLSEVSSKNSSQKLSWHARKTNYLNHLRTVQNPETLLVSLSDKIYNLQNLLHDYHLLGSKLWQHFGAPLPDQLWYYTSLLEIFQSHSLPAPLLKTYQDLLATFRSLPQP